MTRRQPHPLALFSLVPLNDRANNILRDNSHLVSTIKPDGKDILGIDIGFHTNSDSRHTLATLGRNGDISVNLPSISRIQCSFEIHEEFGTVILYDRSTSQTTQVFGENCIPFEPGCIRRIAVAEDLNTVLGMGGVGCDLIKFELVWHQRMLRPRELVRDRIDNPRLARTVDEAPTVAPSARLTRIHTPNGRYPKLRYAKMGELGRGQFGEVCRAIDAESGRAMAVKVVKRPVLGFEEGPWILLKREVETLAQISHPCIVEYIGVQSVKEQLEIFMALKDGSVEVLMGQGCFKQEFSYEPADILLHHVLMGIDYLSSVKIVHRDLKPANILFTKKSASNFQFQIADFGLCNFADDAQTYTGSPMFMAPEVLRNDGGRQTSKVDVWSLFVTMAFVMDVNGYRKKRFSSHNQIVNAALEAAETPLLSPLKDMAVLDSNKRAAAADMLQKLFNGEGITKPLDDRQERPFRCRSEPHVKDARIRVDKVQTPSLNRQPPLSTAKARARFGGIAKVNVERSPGHAAGTVKFHQRRKSKQIPAMFPTDA